MSLSLNGETGAWGLLTTWVVAVSLGAVRSITNVTRITDLKENMRKMQEANNAQHAATHGKIDRLLDMLVTHVSEKK